MTQATCLAAFLISLGLSSHPRAIEAQETKKAKIGANLTVDEIGAWRVVRSGIEFRKLALERSEPNYLLDLKLVRFDPTWFTPRILHSSDFQLKGASGKTFVEKTGASAAVNANYFDEKGRPLAYLKTVNGEINRNVSKHALYTGIFGIREGMPFVAHRDEFDPVQASQALQSGPLLLNRGTPVEVMRGLTRYARRAVIGIDREKRVIVAVTDVVFGGLSFAELQELFGNSRWQIDTPDLLNLDGGGSAQFYLKAGQFEELVAGTADVPVAIGFFAKSH